jgi:hypothetical protein
MRKVDLEEVLTRRLRLVKPRFKLERMGGTIAGSVISRSFKGKRDMVRLNMIWDALEAELGRDAVRKVGTLLAYSDDEWDMGEIEFPKSTRSMKSREKSERSLVKHPAGDVTMMAVPVDLVPKVQKLIARRAG